MTSRKAFSDGRHKREMSQPEKIASIDCAIRSNLDAARLAPFYESKSATDPWASFRAAGEAKHASASIASQRVPKRARDELLMEQETNHGVAEVDTVMDSATAFDPNFEFTHPPWLSSQESVS